MGAFRRGVEAAEHRHLTRLRRWKRKSAELAESRFGESTTKLAREILELGAMHGEGPPNNPQYRPEKMAWALDW